MVKDQRLGQVILLKNTNTLCIILCLRNAVCLCCEHSRNSMETRVSFGVRIGMKLMFKPYLQRCFLQRLSYGCPFKGLSVIHKAAGYRPAKRRIFSFNEDNSFAAFKFYNYIHRWYRGFEPVHGLRISQQDICCQPYFRLEEIAEVL